MFCLTRRAVNLSVVLSVDDWGLGAGLFCCSQPTCVPCRLSAHLVSYSLLQHCNRGLPAGHRPIRRRLGQDIHRQRLRQMRQPLPMIKTPAAQQESKACYPQHGPRHAASVKMGASMPWGLWVQQM